MAFDKKKSTAAAPAAAPAAAAPVAAEAPKAASGTNAAVSRLKKAEPAASAKTGYVGRDFDGEARGKTRCVQFQAALASPAIAGMKFETMAEYLELCRQAAEYGTAYTFGDELPK